MKISSVLLFIMLQKVHIPIRFYRILRTADGISHGEMDQAVVAIAA